MSHGSFDGTRFHTQGAGSKNFKLRVLCASCNNAATAAPDRALDAFLRYALEHEDDAWLSRKVLLDHAPGQHAVHDLYRALLKLEFSRHAAHGVPIHGAVADFVAGSGHWSDAAALVRVKFRAVQNLRAWSIRYPSESDFRYLGPFYYHQIHFGWLGVHFLSVHDLRSAPLWEPWSTTVTDLEPCTLIGGELDPAI